MKPIQGHTKKSLLDVVRRFNLHYAIRNYSKLRKNDLISKMLVHLTYDKDAELFKRKKNHASPTKKKPRRVALTSTSSSSSSPASAIAPATATDGQRTEGKLLRALASRAAEMDNEYSHIVF